MPIIQESSAHQCEIKLMPFAERKNVAIGETRQAFIDGILLGRGEEPDDIAKYVSFLVSDQADYITGQSLAVDGGVKFQ